MPVNPFERDNNTMTDAQETGRAEEKKPGSGVSDDTNAFLKDLKAVLEIDKTDGSEEPEQERKNEISQSAEKPEVHSALDQTKIIQETVKAAQVEKPERRASAERTAEPAADAPTARFFAEEVDDENLLAEIHALIGDPVKPKPIQGGTSSPFSKPSASRTPPAQRPLARITPDALKNVPDDFEDVAEADTMGIPGCLKGLCILLLSMLLCAMIVYAVASDVLGQAL